ncbi:MAG: hypothetical protein KGQ79_03935 [Proteobacteria bacterium]|nr:hypothetical protein [Pseudomonadota bacterium]
MTGFVPLELAVLRAIFDETPEFVEQLQRQLAKAIVLERENTGLGFLTTMSVSDDLDAIKGPLALGYTVYAQVGGLKHGLGVALLLKNGLLHQLDFFSCVGESTNGLNISEVKFELTEAPFGN